jgi:hypothetical protein
MLRIVLLLVAVFISSGCATITRGTTEVLVINSEPIGADVEILPAGVTCKTPCSIELKRKFNQTVKIRKDGFEPVDVNVLPQTSGAGGAGMAGNVLVGGLIGAAVDAGSGAMKDLKPNPVEVKLVPISPPMAASAAAQDAHSSGATSSSSAAEATQASPPAPTN